jgi:hypothetical protein
MNSEVKVMPARGGARQGAGRPRKFPAQAANPAAIAKRVVRLRKLMSDAITELAFVEAERRAWFQPARPAIR